MDSEETRVIEETRGDGVTASMLSRHLRYRAGEWERTTGQVIVETPVSLTVNGQVWLSLMCTPVDLPALAVGFLFNERVINGIAEIESLRVCPQMENIDIWLSHPVEKPPSWTRTSGCSGGATSVSAIMQGQNISRNGGVVRPADISRLMAEFSHRQTLYRQTGGVHTSALSDGNQIVMVAEDIGRHNTLDKLSGRCLAESIHLARRIILTTGRVSSEMLQKAARMSAAIIISRTSPSSRSIEMAETLGITLIGYARHDAFTVYTHPERIQSVPELKTQEEDGYDE